MSLSSICLDLRASFVIFGSLSSYISVLMILMTGYSLKSEYCIPKFSYLFNIGNFAFCLPFQNYPSYPRFLVGFHMFFLIVDVFSVLFLFSILLCLSTYTLLSEGSLFSIIPATTCIHDI